MLEESEFELDDFVELEELSVLDEVECEELDELDEREEVLETETLRELDKIDEREADEETLGPAIVVVLATGKSDLVYLSRTCSQSIHTNPNVACK